MSGIMSETDLKLLVRFAQTGCNDAFGEIVRRHVNLVFSAAQRRLPNAALAEEVSQTVFLELAQNAHRLDSDTVLSAWLYRAALNRSVDVVRREARRQRREQIAVEMLAMNPATDDWSRIEPLLDEAMSSLGEGDRTAVILRFFENRPLREVGERLKISDDAAQKRVQRAVDRLREFLVARGIPVGSVGLAAIVAEYAVQAAPIELAAQISRAAAQARPLHGTPVAARRGLLAAAGLNWMFRNPIALSLAAVTLTGVAGYRLVGSWTRNAPLASRSVVSDGDARNLRSETTRSDGTQSRVTGIAEIRKPDPLELLQGVARARRRIEFGSSEWEIAVEIRRSGRKETNRWRVVSVVDHDKCRIEQTGTEYRYAFSQTDQESIQRRADAMSREDAVRSGFVVPFESRHVIVYDGSALLDYFTAGNELPRTDIRDPRLGTTSFVIDPRRMGLRASPSAGSTVEGCLGYGNAKSFECLGSELVRGTLAWHVRVKLKGDAVLDFWMDVARPERLIQAQIESETVVSDFEDGNGSDPIPSRVTVLNRQPNASLPEIRYLRTRFESGTPPKSGTFDLSGLGMAVGTDVTDDRISRRIGYWNGSGLSEYPPGSSQDESDAINPTTALDLSERVRLLETSSTTPEALESAKWILLNTPDGAQTDLAISVILHDHTRAPGLAALCQELLRLRPRRGVELLTAILRENPEIESRGAACFSLANWYKDDARFGENQPALASAVKHFERVIAEFGDLRDTAGFRLRERAAPQLHELQHLTLGHPAPSIDGTDLNGSPLSLTQFKGRVVVLQFWNASDSDAQEHHAMAERLSSDSVAVVGVCVARDLDQAKSLARKHDVNSPSFWDRSDGPISRSYHLESWPSVWVLDRSATIRFRAWGGNAVDQAVKALLKSGE